jgi:hypothetical protein
MTPRQDKTITIAGREFVRVPIRATARMAHPDSLPKHIQSACLARASKLHFQDVENPDLVWVQFILDTEGGNKNWDYNPRSAMVRHYSTAAFKPVDMEHVIEEKASMVNTFGSPPVRNTIFGVMSHASLCWADGTLIPEDEVDQIDLTDDMDRPDSEKLCVTAWAALYAYLFPQTVADVCDRIDKGKMAASMERWIDSYDFLVKDEGADEYKAISRTTASTNGVLSRWTSHQMSGNSPIYRRSLSFCYGGAASTISPANTACQFVPTDTGMKAVASDVGRNFLHELEKRHCEIEETFAVSSTAAQNDLIAEHQRLTHLYGILTGQIGGVT